MTHNLKRYSTYKPSGIEWLGDVPAHWEVRPNHTILAEVNERNHPDEQMLSVTITKGVIHQRSLLEDSSKKDTSRLDRSAYKLVRRGDIAYNKMRAWQGAIGASEYHGIVSPAYVVQRPRNGANSRYLHYLLRTRAFAKEAERWSYGITSDMWSLRPEHFKTIYTCVPPLPEQAAIVRFLDHKTAEIDEAISKKQRLIDLLKEQKAILIEQAVTKGLNSNVPMRDSGVKWIGEVPVHWEVISLRAAAHSIQTGPFGSQLHASDYVSGGIPVINPSHMRNGGIESDPSSSINQHKVEELSRHQLQPCDIVMARRGELGRCALVTDVEAGWLCGTGSLRIRPKSRIFTPAYLLLILNTQGIRDTLSLSSVGATMDNLNAGMVSRLRLPLPPFLEQVAIVEYLDKATAAIATAIARTRRQISLLREYRAILIADVVTGKLDVREDAPHES